MAGIPVVIVSSGGLAVVEAENGLSVDVATNGYGLSVTIVQSGRGLPVTGLGPIILLSASAIAEDASVGDLIGSLSIGGNATGNWLDPITYTLTNDAGGKYAIDGDDLEVAAALSDGTDSITVEADNGTDTPISRTFTINITNVDEPDIFAPFISAALDPSDDDGDSDSDGITTITRPGFLVTLDLEDGDSIQMLDGGSPAGDPYVAGPGDVDDDAVLFFDHEFGLGSHPITFTSTRGAQTSAPFSAGTVTIVSPATGDLYELVAHASEANTGSGAPITTSGIDTTGANLITVEISQAASFTLGTISDNKGNTYTPRTEQTSTGIRGKIFYCISPTVGAGHTFSFTATGAGLYGGITVQAWTKSSGTPVYDSENGGQTSSAVTTLSTGSVTPSTSGALIVASLGTGLSAPPSIDNGFTVIDHENSASGVNYSLSSAYLHQTTATAVNPAFSWTGAAEAVATIAVFK